MSSFEKIFPGDQLSKRERVERTLNFQPVDRVPLHEQLSYNPGVIALYLRKPVHGFDYTLEDIGAVIRQTLDACFPPVAPLGTRRVVNADGFEIQNDNWTSWTVSRPFQDLAGAREFLLRKTERILKALFNADQEHLAYQSTMQHLQRLVGETVIIDYPVQD